MPIIPISVEVPLPDISNRNFAKRGSTINLRIATYNNGALADPSVAGDVKIYRGSTLLVTKTAAKISTGIFTVSYDVAADAALGTYKDQWTDIVMEGGDNPVTYEFEFYVVASNLPVPSTTDECTIFEYIRDDQGKPIANVIGYAYTANRPYTIDDASSAEDVTKALTDASGRISWKMPIGADIVVDIPTADIYVKKNVPDQPTVQITKMTNALE